MSYEWTEISYIQIGSGKDVQNMLAFPLAVVCVFLVLAALYESWSLPLAVILGVTLCILGSICGVALTDGDINIFTQVGFVVLVAVASKERHSHCQDLPRSSGWHEQGRSPGSMSALRLRPDSYDLLRFHPQGGALAAGDQGRERRCGASWGPPSSAVCSA